MEKLPWVNFLKAYVLTTVVIVLIVGLVIGIIALCYALVKVASSYFRRDENLNTFDLLEEINKGNLDLEKVKFKSVEDLKDFLSELGFEDTVMLVDPDYLTAVVGIRDFRIQYDYEKMVEFLMVNEGMTEEEAMESIDYNTLRAIPYMGDKAPEVLEEEDIE